MSSRIGPSDADRYGWPGASPGVLAEGCAPVARQIARARMGSVAFIPGAGALAAGASLAPLVVAVADALLGFVPGEVGIIDSWPTWPWGEASEPTSQSIYRQRRLAPRLVELAPLPCGDPQAAAVALQATLASRPRGLAVVLVNLAGYVALGGVPAAIDFVDGALLVVRARRSFGGRVTRQARFIPAAKNLGAILVD